MPDVTGVLETALYIDDLERASKFYQELFGFGELLADERMRALNVAGKQALLLFKKGASKQDNPVPGGIVPPHAGAG